MTGSEARAFASSLGVEADCSGWSYRVCAFVEERDVSRVQVGQVAVVTADAVPDREFLGKVAVVVPRRRKRSIRSNAPGQYREVYFREVFIDLQNPGELALNMRIHTRIVISSPEEAR
jgi:hypothetical protein